MIAFIILIALLIVAAIALTIFMHAADHARQEEFDGGFHHDNATRITRVRGTYIIAETENDQ